MSNQLNIRGVSSNRYAPIWAWYIYESRSRPRPDLRHSWLLPPKTKGALIQLNVPEDYFVLSQFEMWIWVLNNRFIPADNEAFESSERLLMKGKLSHDVVMKSWENIFDLEFGAPDFWKPHDERSVQASLPFMMEDWIEQVTHFTAR